jgi:hypothetical protein
MAKERTSLTANHCHILDQSPSILVVFIDNTARRLNSTFREICVAHIEKRRVEKHNTRNCAFSAQNRCELNQIAFARFLSPHGSEMPVLL